jgi:plasmid stabilization system protein ParE
MGGAIQSLADFPERGRAGPESMRELVVPFGRDGYVLRYRLGPELILVTRIFHTRERR